MKVEIIMRTEGQPDSIVAEAEADGEAPMFRAMAAALTELANNFTAAAAETQYPAH